MRFEQTFKLFFKIWPAFAGYEYFQGRQPSLGVIAGQGIDVRTDVLSGILEQHTAKRSDQLLQDVLEVFHERSWDGFGGGFGKRRLHFFCFGNSNWKVEQFEVPSLDQRYEQRLQGVQGQAGTLRDMTDSVRPIQVGEQLKCSRSDPNLNPANVFNSLERLRGLHAQIQCVLHQRHAFIETQIHR